MDTPLDRLLRRLDLEALGGDRFCGQSGKGEGRLFGGFVAAQAAVAAARTAAERRLHSLHAYFLRGGHHLQPIEYRVERLRDGRTFAARRVDAVQGGAVIFSMLASFALPEEGIAHQEPMPAAPPPTGALDWEEVRAAVLGEGARRPDGPLEVRDCDAEVAEPAKPQPAYRRIWLRPRGHMPEDPLLHVAMLVFASDRTLLSTGGRPHALTWNRRMGASLDHAVWLHRPARFDDWILYVSQSPAAHAGRALVHGAMYSRDGTRIASVAQEGVIR